MEFLWINDWQYNSILRHASEWWKIIANTNWYNLTNILRIKNESKFFLIVPTDKEWMNINIFSKNKEDEETWKSIWKNLTLE